MSDLPPNLRASEDSGEVPSWAWWATAIVIVLVLVLVVGAVLLAVYADAAAPIVEILRDLFIILLLLTLIVSVTAVVVLTVQIARYVNLLMNESAPIIEGTEDTVRVLRGTVYFLSKHLTEPVVKSAAAVAAVTRIIGDASAIRKHTRGPMSTYVDGSERAEDSQPARSSDSALDE